MPIMHIIFFIHRCVNLVVAMVTEIVKLLHKHMDPEITPKLFKLAW